MIARRRLLAAAASIPMLSRAGAGRAFAQAAVETERDIVFGETAAGPLLLDISRPPSGEPLPAVILIHGGAWTQGFGSRSNMTTTAQKLATAGYVAFNISYRLLGGPGGDNRWPSQIDDVQRAVRWVRANAGRYGVDPDRIAAYGHSAGGHLAAMLGVRDTRDDTDPELAGMSSRVNAVIDLAGDMDLTIPYPQAMDREIVVDLMGGTIDEVPDAYRDASPLSWVDAETVPFLIVHGTRDDVNPVEHARRMADALHRTEVAVVYAELPTDHFMAGDWSVAGPWVLTFLAVQFPPNR